MILKVSPFDTPTIGSAITFSISQERICLFDAQTENVIE